MTVIAKSGWVMAARTGRAALAAVIGHPVAHSLSPAIHEYWLQERGIDGAYIPLAVAGDDFTKAVSFLMRAGFRGCNVTIPHKETAFRLCDVPDEAAQRAGAVNTLWFEAGRVHGANTDGYGFIRNLSGSGFDPAGKKIIVLGAGGAARAIVMTLGDAKAGAIVIVNRTGEKAAALVDACCRYGVPCQASGQGMLARELDDCHLLINTTPCGMADREAFELDLSPMPDGAAVCDIVYTPLMTPLLREAKGRGLTVIDGLGMLLHQAAPGFARWFGVMPEVTPGLRNHVVALLPS